jgi:hypothetical protein
LNPNLYKLLTHCKLFHSQAILEEQSWQEVFELYQCVRKFYSQEENDEADALQSDIEQTFSTITNELHVLNDKQKNYLDEFDIFKSQNINIIEPALGLEAGELEGQDATQNDTHEFPLVHGLNWQLEQWNFDIKWYLDYRKTSEDEEKFIQSFVKLNACLEYLAHKNNKKN